MGNSREILILIVVVSGPLFNHSHEILHIFIHQYPRIMMCMEANGHSLKPNFFTVDWADIGDSHEGADYLNFGGRLGVGQRCKSGLDCATGTCSKAQHEAGCSGCGLGEICIDIKETGVHECTANSSEVILIYPSNDSNPIQFQSSAFFIFHALVLLRIFISALIVIDPSSIRIWGYKRVYIVHLLAFP